MTVPFTEDEIIGVVDAKFKRGRFNDDIDSEDSDSDDSGFESDSESESDFSDSDDETEYKKKKSKASKSKPVAKKQVKHTRSSRLAGNVSKPVTATPSTPDTSKRSEIWSNSSVK
jgi:U3 small nucleolar RNA-associated protein 14